MILARSLAGASFAQWSDGFAIGFQWTARRRGWKGDGTCSGIALCYARRRVPAAWDASRRAVSSPIAGASIARATIAFTT